MRDNILRLGKETLIYGTSTIVARLFNFFLVPVYTYYLITSDYGIIATVFAFMALMNIIYQYGMDQAYLRFAKDKDGKDVFATPFIAVLVSAILISAIICLLSPWLAALLGIGRQNAYLIQIACVVMAFDALNIVPFAKLRFTHRPWYFVAARTLSILVNVAGNIIALAWLSAGLSGIFIAGIFASLTSLILLIPVIKEDFVPRFNKPLFKEMFAFSWPFIPAGMASILVNVIDKPLLSHLAGLGEVGVYQANFKIGIFMMLIVSMFDQAWRPFFIQQASKADHKELFAKILTYFTALATWIFLGLTMLMPTIIKTKFFGVHLIHPNYWGGMGIIPLVLAGYLFYGFYINFMVAPVLTKKTRVLMWITLLGALSSIVVNIILVPSIGIIGAGWAILTSYIVMAASLFIFLERNYPIIYEYRKLTLMAAATILMLLLNLYFGGVDSVGNTALLIKIAALAIYPLAMCLIIKDTTAHKKFF
ncbi:MAG: oligosaccharide flippase family protein [Elusimicrobiota bacterium]|jgi:O-antigen/teichoic acid export membrane protein|nr:oligosaccharide flippase family protein [Elusimicrobiota bacterium]